VADLMQQADAAALVALNPKVVEQKARWTHES
jgi:hypothetical protein